MNGPSGRQARTWRLVAAALGLLLLVLAGLAAVSSPRISKQGSELFGRVIRVVQRRPGTVAGVALGSVAAVWLAIGLGVALESWPRGDEPSGDSAGR